MASSSKQPSVFGSPIDDATAGRISKIEALLRPIAKYKERSYETSNTAHVPILKEHFNKAIASPTNVVLGSSAVERMATMTLADEKASPQTPTPSAKAPASPATANSDPIETVLIGDSMLERMTTTGYTVAKPLPRLGQWPSPAMMDNPTLKALSLQRLHNILNLGVGGDKIQNIAYRLIGDPDKDPKRHLHGYVPALAKLNTIKLWVVQAGTNNLQGRKGLVERDIDGMGALLRSLLLISGEGGKSRILLTGLFPRSDITEQVVEEANRNLEGLAKEINKEERHAKDRVVFLPATKEVYDNSHFVDHVHLSLEGYRIWMKDLFPKALEVLRGG